MSQEDIMRILNASPGKIFTVKDLSAELKVPTYYVKMKLNILKKYGYVKCIRPVQGNSFFKYFVE